MVNNFTLRDLDPATLYDIFYENGTRLGGMFVALARQAEQNHDEPLRNHYVALHRQLFEERASVGAYDTERQIECIHRWSQQVNDLIKELDYE